MSRTSDILLSPETVKKIESSCLRDKFATAAITGILAGWNYEAEGRSVFNPNIAVKRAYKIADAMIQERGVV